MNNQQGPYSLSAEDKAAGLLASLNELTVQHAQNCPPYQRLVKTLFPGGSYATALDEVPYLPVRLFKEFNLKSIPDDQVFKVLYSSGTTGQRPSTIYLDNETARLQSETLVKIMSTVLGKRRLPMLIIDSKSVLSDREAFTARGAGILGMSSFGRNPFYALDADMELDLEGLRKFVHQNHDSDILIFGFTFMVWKYFAERLTPGEIDLSRATLIHSGGWKKLQDQAVGNDTFKAKLADVAGIRRVHSFYGMVEQVGSVFLECEAGRLHAPDYAEIIIRDPETWNAMPFGHEGIVQVLSTLPRSYPGHSLLTEDVGTIDGEDDCACGRMGRYFSIKGRLARAEIRGCSDTHAATAGATT